MDIKKKMKLCFNDKLESNTILTENEKKVLAALLYSYKVCKDAKDGIVIRGTDKIRKDVKIKNSSMYDALRNLECVYSMLEWTRGEKRELGKPAKAAQFKLNFQNIFNPPTEPVKFSFEEELKSSEMTMGTASTNTITKEREITTIMKDERVNEKGTKTSVEKDAETLRKIEIKKELEEQLKNWTVKVNSRNSCF